MAFVINPELTAIAVAYTNRRMIADEVLPRIAPIGTRAFKYRRFPIGEGFTVPETAVGRRGAPNVVEFGGSLEDGSVADYGLEDEIPQDDIDQAGQPNQGNVPSPQARSTEMLTNLVVLDREVRVAGIVFNPATYAGSSKIQLAGSAQWSDASSDPIAVISDAIEGRIVRPNIAVFGSQTWTSVRRHPKIVKAVNKTSGDTGMVSREAFAEMFELEEVLVGEGFVNTANKGQNEVFSRAWGKHAAFIHRDKLADTRRGVTFGMTVPYGARVAGDSPDSRIGLRGGVRVRVGESVKELITAPDAAYFFQDAVA